MNKVIIMGRLTRDAEVRYSQGEKQMAIARFSMAVDRRIKRDGEQNADFISCVAFQKLGEFFEKFGRKGTKLLWRAGFRPVRIQTETARRFTRQMWLWNLQNLQSARQILLVRELKKILRHRFRRLIRNL